MAPRTLGSQPSTKAATEIPTSRWVGYGGVGSPAPAHCCAHAVAPHIVARNGRSTVTDTRFTPQKCGYLRCERHIELLAVMQDGGCRKRQPVAELRITTTAHRHTVDRIKRHAIFRTAPWDAGAHGRVLQAGGHVPISGRVGIQIVPFGLQRTRLGDQRIYVQTFS